ncbi:hydrophobic protein [Streptomyces sp. AV19]|uniref:hydrophobic protein n=1 Tax=Streptomyces sp. AV19 TaxID=2793068 RepID=UPI0018FE0B9E|nr:hydrophobic protein [Streptomyces sp. AV19]MBH1932989.1 hydrophobic protein [Streptomyces sp. AV19]MDG4533838.1 hydrophobic protein [Streptomyces sp. AV19]
MLPLPLVLILAVVLFGAGFALEVLWWAALVVLVVLVVRLPGFPVRSGGGRRYR